jgi:hypothetical protein
MTIELQDSLEFSDKTLKEKVKDFSALLNQIESIDDKKKQLWKEIYENAVCDRQNAYIMFTKLVMIVQDKSTEHAVHGRNLSSYIERMSKANDQLIKLAELVAKAESAAEVIDPDEVFSKIRDN